MKPAILRKDARYDAQVRQLLTTLADYSDEQLNRKPANGGWSAIQVLHHLLLVEDLSLGYVRKKLSFQPKVEKAGLSSYLRGWFVSAYLGSPLKRKAPAGVGDAHLPTFATLADTRVRWEQVRQAWATFFNELPPELLDKEVYKHPFAGRLGWSQTIAFFEAHFQRHRKQALRAVANGEV